MPYCMLVPSARVLVLENNEEVPMDLSRGSTARAATKAQRVAGSRVLNNIGKRRWRRTRYLKDRINKYCMSVHRSKLFEVDFPVN